jgi:hypothetical protein
MLDAFSPGDVDHYSGEEDLQIPLIREIVRYLGGDITVQHTPPDEIGFRVCTPAGDGREAVAMDGSDAQALSA